MSPGHDIDRSSSSAFFRQYFPGFGSASDSSDTAYDSKAPLFLLLPYSRGGMTNNGSTTPSWFTGPNMTTFLSSFGIPNGSNSSPRTVPHTLGTKRSSRRSAAYATTTPNDDPNVVVQLSIVTLPRVPLLGSIPASQDEGSMQMLLTPYRLHHQNGMSGAMSGQSVDARE
ncbi:hypothetical protein PILCRDRAFT_11882 [Piloderma croceum F 1598]|uniref:Uncharacterized protein n=1 Tax=Piloderma croceum (strain F 1598) TaxID=765440 RepID=A0A0C3AUN7_PILCF|nr:hypothetical protein PILCRDRAFT_11882 [Piloderma croceum F 1598]